MSRSPNDDRSDTLNPNNDAYHYAQLNQNPEDDDYFGGEHTSPTYSKYSRSYGKFVEEDEVPKEKVGSSVIVISDSYESLADLYLFEK